MKSSTLYSITAALATIGLTAAVLSLGPAAPAFSQERPCAAAGAGSGYGPGMGRGPGGRFDAAARSAAGLESLRGQLALDASQESAWQAYADAVRAQATNMAQDRAQMWNDTGTAPERATRSAKVMADHAAQHAKVAEALGGLYAVLNAAQRATLDRQSMPGGGPLARR